MFKVLLEGILWIFIERKAIKKTIKNGNEKIKTLLTEKNERIEKDPYIEIIKYKELLDREIITEDEFQLKKKELLNL
ncbi:SHOCT domain-containing protein [Sebaldella sp. S0638]|uniref:SHOCT domain-containing protein n=1 Tax=Sebaldella sp. S0638 TaxID=2957809 RepID=UPI00209F7A42|nr:SHOCT domain-containing protein [Sebaldella sp. S0638]MCP1223285.1 SHOCT domain-containing protein [Sebaldella sp. S0638]